MRIKIGNKVYDSRDVPLAVEFEDEEINYLRATNKEVMPNNRFTAYTREQFPTDEEAREWLNDWETNK